MPIPILVVTPSETFGAVIRTTLANAGDYEIELATTGHQALSLVRSRQFSLAILDSDLPRVSLTTLGNALRALAPELDLIFLAAKEAVEAFPPPLVGPAAYLPKPFTRQDLIQLISRHPARPAPDPRPEKSSGPAPVELDEQLPTWLQDQTRAAQQLTRLLLEAGAQAALIIRQRELWAYAGELSRPAADELARRVSRYRFLGSPAGRTAGQQSETTGKTLGDVARFVHLAATGQDLLLYATQLLPDLVLALGFDTETPFSQIRLLTGQLAHSLAFGFFEEEAGNQPAFQAGPAPDTDPSAPAAVFPVKLPEAPGSGTLLPPPGLSNLQYAAVLIPRMPQHFITGELMLSIGEWVRKLCVAFGWRLEYISVRPAHLAWICRVQADTSPGEMVHHLRSQTSRRIFATFPGLAEENPSGDFWAPGSLLITSSSPPSAGAVKQFIQTTRQQQGATGG